jgi:hypothetical protein
MVFGIFSMLGFRFAPRFADLGDQRFWRADVPSGDAPSGEGPDEETASGYGALEAIARSKSNRTKIQTQWSDMVRVAGSLVTNQVRAYDLLRMFSRNGNLTPLGQAFAEYGRFDKTLYLLSSLDPINDTYHRKLNKQLTVQESRHRLARKICHGGSGQIRQAYREGQEDQLAALGLVVNAVALWNTRYLSAAVEHLRAPGVPVKDEDVARLSPLGHAHVNFLGRYAIASSGPSEGLRELGEIPDLPEINSGAVRRAAEGQPSPWEPISESGLCRVQRGRRFVSSGRTRCPRCPASRGTTRFLHRRAGAARVSRREGSIVRIRPRGLPGALHRRVRCRPARQGAADS